jgi:multidrug efflux pump subunit AcrB
MFSPSNKIHRKVGRTRDYQHPCSYDVLKQRATFIHGVYQFKIQRFVTKIFIVIVVVVIVSVIILGVLYINFIVTFSGQVSSSILFGGVRGGAVGRGFDSRCAHSDF